MQAGEEMDALVLSEIFGIMPFKSENCKPYKLDMFQNPEPISYYSGDIFSAWAIVDKLRKDDVINIWCNYNWYIVTIEKPKGDIEGKAESLPHAICRAALLAVVPA